MARLDGRSFAIGALSALCAVLFLNMNQPDPEMRKLREFAGRLNDRGDLDMGNRKILMLGSQIYDDGTEGGGLQLRGGANRVHLVGEVQLWNQLVPRQPTLRIPANLDLGTRKILMQGSAIWDDGSQGGGLLIQGGANRIHHFGQVIPH